MRKFIKSNNGLIFIYFLTSGICFLTSLYGEESGVGFPLLNMSYGTRGSAMGGAYSGLADDITALYWNPGGLAQLSQNEVLLCHQEWFQDIRDEYAMVGFPTKIGTFAAGLCYSGDAKEIEEYTGDNQPVGGFTTYEWLLNIGYAKETCWHLFWGVSCKALRTELYQDRGTAFLGDAGLLWAPQEKIKLGLSIQNIGTGMHYESGTQDKLPWTARIGASLLLIPQFVLTGEADFPEYGSYHYHTGAELNIRNIIFLRGGYRTGPQSIKWCGDESAFSGGVGVAFRNFSFGYTYVPYGNLGQTQRMSLSVKFGKKEITKPEVKEIVAKAEEKAPEPEVKEEIAEIEIEIEEERKDIYPPSIFIISPQDKAEVREEKVIIKGIVYDDCKIDSVLLNGNLLTQSRGITVMVKLEVSAVDTFFFEQEIDLAPGINTFSIKALDKAGHKSTKTLTINRIVEIAEKEVPKFRGQRWAVVIGISEYQYSYKGIPNLRYADRDAQAFYDFIRSPQGGGFPPSHVRLLLNESATLEEVKDALFEFLGQAIEEDLVFIYFAGHGAPEPATPDNLYLLTYDADPEKLASTAFPMWDIETALKRYIKSERVIMIADACHSAGVSEQLAMRDISTNLINKYLSQLESAGKGRAIFTASESGESSQESKKWGGGHGVFTYYLLEGLKGEADYDENGVVTFGEMTNYVSEKVRRATRSKQHPTTAGRFDVNLPMGVVE